jgi:hypothetical protein
LQAFEEKIMARFEMQLSDEMLLKLKEMQLRDGISSVAEIVRRAIRRVLDEDLVRQATSRSDLEHKSDAPFDVSQMLRWVFARSLKIEYLLEHQMKQRGEEAVIAAADHASARRLAQIQ